MNIEVKAKDKDGNVTFEGSLTKNELTFVLNVGINYLLAQGAMPFTGVDEDTIVAEPSETVQ